MMRLTDAPAGMTRSEIRDLDILVERGTGQGSEPVQKGSGALVKVYIRHF